MTELETKDYQLRAFMQNLNSIYLYNEFIKAIKSKDNKAIEESRVFEAIHRMITRNNLMRHKLEPGTTLYRCRIIKEKDWETSNNGISIEHNHITGFDKYNSKEPPLGLAPDGRANCPGSTYLYVANNKYTACAEVRPRLMDFISVAEFKVCRSLVILDFSENQNVHSLTSDDDNVSIAKLITNVMYEFCSVVSNSEKYTVTQYISDYIRKHGIDGICYRSSLTNGKNYTIFNCAEDNIQFQSSSIYFCQNINYDFIDINKEKFCRQKHSCKSSSISKICSKIKQEIQQILANRKK